jgi:hypothetical protein
MPTDTSTELFAEFTSVDWDNLAAVSAGVPAMGDECPQI